ncbi:MAG: hypothetical protein JKY70_05025 [Mucilaginibacter sp.]|nr:hypothetical protein [Mucilaginibacter sp.]
MKKHQGEIIEYVVRRNGYNISELARAIGLNRRTLYNYFRSPSVKSSIIYRIGIFLGHDFSKEFPELFTEGEFQTRSKELVRGATRQEPFRDDEAIYKAKYLGLLEKYHEILNSLLETN